jgi:hypothetical protein
MKGQRKLAPPDPCSQAEVSKVLLTPELIVGFHLPISRLANGRQLDSQ